MNEWNGRQSARRSWLLVFRCQLSVINQKTETPKHVSSHTFPNPNPSAALSLRFTGHTKAPATVTSSQAM